MRTLLCSILLVACSSAVKHAGFKAHISRATDPALTGDFEGADPASCGRLSPDRAEIRLRGDGFELTVVEEPRGGAREAVLIVAGETYRSDRPGGTTHLVADDIGGRVIGSMSGVLVHESAGTLAAGRSAPVRDLELDLTFNLQICL